MRAFTSMTKKAEALLKSQTSSMKTLIIQQRMLRKLQSINTTNDASAIISNPDMIQALAIPSRTHSQRSHHPREVPAH